MIRFICLLCLIFNGCRPLSRSKWADWASLLLLSPPSRRFAPPFPHSQTRTFPQSFPTSTSLPSFRCPLLLLLHPFPFSLVFPLSSPLLSPFLLRQLLSSVMSSVVSTLLDSASLPFPRLELMHLLLLKLLRNVSSHPSDTRNDKIRCCSRATTRAEFVFIIYHRNMLVIGFSQLLLNHH